MNPHHFEHAPGFIAPEHQAEVMERILSEVTTERSEIRIFGQVYETPRLMAWHGDPGAAYAFGSQNFDPKPWTPTLEALRAALSAREGVRFNSCLVNLYRDGSDSIAYHADDEPELGPTDDDVRIASLSLGATRRFRLKGPEGTQGFNLAGGDLVVMRGTLQRTHKHCVPKTKKPVGARLNLTFRVIR